MKDRAKKFYNENYIVVIVIIKVHLNIYMYVTVKFTVSGGFKTNRHGNRFL